MGNYILPCIPLGCAVGQLRSKVPQERPLSGELQGKFGYYLLLGGWDPCVGGC